MRHITHLQAVTGPRAAKPREEAPARSETEIQRAIIRADAALGAAGHEVTDEETRELGRQVAAGSITGDEAAARIVAKLHAKQSDRPS